MATLIQILYNILVPRTCSFKNIFSAEGDVDFDLWLHVKCIHSDLPVTCPWADNQQSGRNQSGLVRSLGPALAWAQTLWLSGTECLWASNQGWHSLGSLSSLKLYDFFFLSYLFQIFFLCFFSTKLENL